MKTAFTVAQTSSYPVNAMVAGQNPSLTTPAPAADLRV
jgi:hypothetical protein